MDLTKALAAKSDQLDFVDLEGLPPQVYTITDVSENGTELADQQPVRVEAPGVLDQLLEAGEQLRRGIGYVIQQHAEKYGYGIVRDYTGHGIGRQMHEAPQIANYGRPGTREKIRVGYCFAIEPMLNLGTHETRTLSDKWTVVTLDGKASAHAEHTLAVTADGPEILTLSKEQKKLLAGKAAA